MPPMRCPHWVGAAVRASKPEGHNITECLQRRKIGLDKVAFQERGKEPNLLGIGEGRCDRGRMDEEHPVDLPA